MEAEVVCSAVGSLSSILLLGVGEVERQRVSFEAIFVPPIVCMSPQIST